ncbi:MAG: M50 family metallopeptidase [Bacteroidetes bacterium]|nr:M50 family metallopeptidase [Bacteroidota bacterium]
MAKKKQSNRIPDKYKELSILLTIVLFSILLWDTFLIYPIKLFVVIWHEIAHGFAAIFTGGRIHEISISFQLGGLCTTEDGIPFLVASSGYLGSLIIGYGIFITSFDPKAGKWLLTTLAVIMILFAANFVSSPAGGIMMILFSALLFLSPRYIPKVYNAYLWRTLGLISCLYVVIDIKQDIFSDIFIRNDAHIIAEITGVSAGFWGFLWLLISLLVVARLIWYTFNKK